MAVTLERTDTEFVIKLPLSINPLELQKALDYFRFIEIVGRSQASQEDIDKLAKEVNSGPPQHIKDRLNEMDEFKGLYE